MLRRVVEKAKLTQDPEFGRVDADLLSFFTSWFRSSAVQTKPNSPGSEGIPPDVLRAIIRLRRVLEVQRVQRTYVISIAVTSEVPEKAAMLANAVADAYVVDQLDAKYDAAKRASLWLAERMEGLREQVQQSEEAVAQFRREHNLLTTTSDNKLTINEQ